MNKLKTAALLLICLIFTGAVRAEKYYVDNLNGSDLNPGTELSPWQTIAKVNSFIFLPGDEILFKRGSIWNETLLINQNGSPSLPIIYGSYGEGNLPAIDGTMSLDYGIYLDGRNNIIVKEFNIYNTMAGGAVRVIRSQNITIKDCQMYITGRAGVFIELSSGCLVAGNTMTTPALIYDIQTDGIYAQRNSDNIYNGNTIIIRNGHPTQHCDAIQFYLETNASVLNNYVEQENTKSGFAHGIYCSENFGIFRVYNNVAYGMYTKSSMIKFKNQSSTGTVEMINNTVYGGQSGLIQTNDPNIIFMNNIVASTGNDAVVIFEKPVANPENINYNLYSRSGYGMNVIECSNLVYKMTDWKSAGYDLNSFEGDPKFLDPAGKILQVQSGSPAIDNGIDLGAPFNFDKIETPRPTGTRTDIGAYEMPHHTLDKTKPAGDEAEETPESVPEKFELSQNYPNPFNPSTIIRFSLPENSTVTLKVYDIIGNEVAVLINGPVNSGIHEVTFDGSNLSSGTYIYRLSAKNFVETRKMILIK